MTAFIINTRTLKIERVCKDRSYADFVMTDCYAPEDNHSYSVISSNPEKMIFLDTLKLSELFWDNQETYFLDKIKDARQKRREITSTIEIIEKDLENDNE